MSSQVGNHRCSSIAKAAQCPRGHALKPVENLKDGCHEEQARAKCENLLLSSEEANQRARHNQEGCGRDQREGDPEKDRSPSCRSGARWIRGAYSSA